MSASKKGRPAGLALVPSGENAEHEAYLHLVATLRQPVQEITTVLKSHHVTAPQFNALRIIHCAGPDGLPSSNIARMRTRVPDVTRPVDRLERIARADRRVVRVVISSHGYAVLDELDEPVRNTHRKWLTRLSRGELRGFTRLLGKARTR